VYVGPNCTFIDVCPSESPVQEVRLKVLISSLQLHLLLYHFLVSRKPPERLRMGVYRCQYSLRRAPHDVRCWLSDLDSNSPNLPRGTVCTATSSETSTQPSGRATVNRVSSFTELSSNGISGPEWAKPIHIGDDCWLGGSVIVLPGVKIGNACTIGAGAVVTKDIPDRSIAVGNPARVIKTINLDGTTSPVGKA
jgi:acetyltransferase-like isoleucine patch superfamily enzyme